MKRRVGVGVFLVALSSLVFLGEESSESDIQVIAKLLGVNGELKFSPEFHRKKNNRYFWVRYTAPPVEGWKLDQTGWYTWKNMNKRFALVERNGDRFNVLSLNLELVYAGAVVKNSRRTRICPLGAPLVFGSKKGERVRTTDKSIYSVVYGRKQMGLFCLNQEEMKLVYKIENPLLLGVQSAFSERGNLHFTGTYYLRSPYNERGEKIRIRNAYRRTVETIELKTLKHALIHEQSKGLDHFPIYELSRTEKSWLGRNLKGQKVQCHTHKEGGLKCLPG